MGYKKFFIIFAIVIIFAVIISLLMWGTHKSSPKKAEMLNIIHSTLASQQDINMARRLSNLPVYYINLDRSTDRRKFIETQLHKYKIPHTTRIPGIDAKKMTNLKSGVYKHDWGDISYTVKNFLDYSEYSPGELGCTLSHLLAIQRARDNGNDLAIIMEDDLSFNLLPHWPIDSVREVMEKAPPDWTVISLIAGHVRCHGTSRDYIAYDTFPCIGTGVYIINRKGMDNVLSGLDHNNFIIAKKFESDKLPADYYIYNRSGHAYTYTKHPLFYVYNDEELNSLIHKEHLDWHIETSLMGLSKYVVVVGDKVLVRRRNNERKIPKILHQTWKTKFLPDKYVEWSNTFKELNPDWSYKLWTDKENREFIRDNYPWFLKTYDGYDKHIKRVDAIRYFLLYHYGGVYADLDFACLKNLDPLIENSDDAIFGYQLHDKESHSAVANAFMATPPRHFLFEIMIHSLESTKKKPVLDATGPCFLTSNINRYMQKWNDIKIIDMPYIYTHEWDDKFACRTIDECKSRHPTAYTTTFWTASWKGEGNDFKYTLPKKVGRRGGRRTSSDGQRIPYRILKVLITDGDELRVSEKMFRCVESWIELNPEYDFVLMDGVDCEKFLENNFSGDVLTAYRMLKPYAYKCDLVRLCWLYRYGGVYSDFRQTLKIPLRQIIKNDIDFIAPNDYLHNKNSTPLLNSFICCTQNHPFIGKSIDLVVKNVLNRYYGSTPLDITGPVVLGRAVNDVLGTNKIFKPGIYSRGGFEYEILKFVGNKNRNEIMQKGRVIIVTKVEDKFTDNIKSGNVYWKMWENKDIYN